MEAMRKGMTYGFPAVSFLFFWSLPAGLQTYFLVTTLFGVGQTYLFQSHAFRRALGITIANPNAAQSAAAGVDPSRALRMVTENLEREQAKLAETEKPAAPQQNLSFIDRAINNVKENKNSITKEASEKMQEIRGSGPKKNADGTEVEQRLSDKDRRLAGDYEKRRKEEEEWKREERNHERRQAHMKQLEKQREQAKSAVKNPRMKQ